jgi:hypothetical protein
MALIGSSTTCTRYVRNVKFTTMGSSGKDLEILCFWPFTPCRSIFVQNLLDESWSDMYVYSHLCGDQILWYSTQFLVLAAKWIGEVLRLVLLTFPQEMNQWTQASRFIKPDHMGASRGHTFDALCHHYDAKTQERKNDTVIKTFGITGLFVSVQTLVCFVALWFDFLWLTTHFSQAATSVPLSTHSWWKRWRIPSPCIPQEGCHTSCWTGIMTKITRRGRRRGWRAKRRV